MRGVGGEGYKEGEGMALGVGWGGAMLGYASIQGGVQRNLRLVVEVVRKRKISVRGLDETNMKGEGLGCWWKGFDGFVLEHSNMWEE